MHSPFPGMDPYLEDPSLWPDVHLRLITITGDSLAAALRPKYIVRIDERLYVSDEDDAGRSVIIPDISIGTATEKPLPPEPEFTSGSRSESATPVMAVTVIRSQIREARIEVLDRQDRRVVTVIEILSPANKIPGSRGHAAYIEKRNDVLESTAHLVEIDLLRAGRRAVKSPAIADCEYYVHVSNSGLRPKGWLWPIHLAEKLPQINIPLGMGDPDTALDLQAVLNTAYDRAGYDLRIDYKADPVPPLNAKLAQWARNLVAARSAE